jgi:DNA-binding NarL/FixJ family response regulator
MRFMAWTGSMRESIKPLQVYVVEDSPIIRRLLTSGIEAAGAELIGESADAPSAVADLAQLRPDLIVIDIALKSGTGFDVLEGLQELDPQPAAIKIVLTNYASAEYLRISLRMGANGFFDKATEAAQVLALIGALAAEKKKRRFVHSGKAEDNVPGSESRT